MEPLNFLSLLLDGIEFVFLNWHYSMDIMYLNVNILDTPGQYLRYFKYASRICMRV